MSNPKPLAAVFISNYSIGKSSPVLCLLEHLHTKYSIDLHIFKARHLESPIMEKINKVYNYEGKYKDTYFVPENSFLNYDIMIALDANGFVLCKSLFPQSKPFYYSLELYFRDNYFNLHYPKEVMEIERREINDISGLIIQSNDRELYFKREYNLNPKIPVFHLPVGYLEGPDISKSNYLRNKYKIDENKKILIHLGGIADYHCLLEIAESFKFVNGWVLIIHGAGVNAYKNKLKELIASQWISNVIVSEEYFDDIDEIDNLLKSADAGLVWYRDVSPNFSTTAKSSGKIAAYLRFGLPIVANYFKSTKELIEDGGCGFCVNNYDEIQSALNKIRLNYQVLRNNCLELYKNVYWFDKYKITLAEFLDKNNLIIKRSMAVNNKFLNIKLNYDTIDLYHIRTSIKSAIENNFVNFKGIFLDLGCGEMPYKEYISANSDISKYIGMDIENPTYQRRIKPDLFWDGKKIPLADNSVDTVMATEVFEHLPDINIVLSEIQRVLRPGGKLFFTVPYLWPLHDVPFDEYRYTPFALERLFRTNGFTDIFIKPFGGWNASLAQMIGLWLRRSGLNETDKSRLTEQFFPFYKQLIDTDVIPANYDKGPMITGLTGIVSKLNNEKNSPASINENAINDNYKLYQNEFVKNGNKIKIIIVVGTFPKISETFILDQITGLLDLGTDLEIWSFNEPKEIIQHKSVSEYKLLERTKYLKLPNNNSNDSDWISFFKSINNLTINDNDVFHIHFGSNFRRFERLFKIIKNKVLVSFHGFDASEYIKKNGNKCYDILFERVSKITTPSYEMQNVLLGIGAAREKMLIHRYGVDIDSYSPGKLKDNNSQIINILSVGRLIEKKGFEYSIRAFAKIFKNKNVLYKIIGEGDLELELKKLVLELGLNDFVVFLGAKSKEDVLEEMLKSDIFILTSITASNGDKEGLPVSLIEAQAVGLPVISTYHAGIPELVINNETGFLLQEKDIDGIASKLDLLVTNHELRKRMVINTRRLVSKSFNIKILNTELLNIYNSLVEIEKEKSEKEIAELNYWVNKIENEKVFSNDHYKYFYTVYFGLIYDFYENKKIIDIGCGPRGSLEWADNTLERYGLDPLSDEYQKINPLNHKMKYIKSGSENIPFPDNYFDVITSFNSLDHVDDLDKTINEIKRVLKPNGLFLLITDVNHKPTPCEPITFSWDIISKFSDEFEAESIRKYEKGSNGIYNSILEGQIYDDNNHIERYGILAAKFVKRQNMKNSVSNLSSNNKPLISIIIPNHNSEKYIKQTIQSVLNQTEGNWELIIVDDCSDDNSVQIIEQYLVDKRIKLIKHSENLKIPQTTIDGILNSSADIFGTLDSDDYLTESAVYEMVKAHKENPKAGLIYSQFMYCDENLKPLKIGFCGNIPKDKTNLDSDKVSHFKTFKREFYDKTIGYEKSISCAVDKDISYKMEEVSELLFVDKVLYLYRVTNNSISHSKKNEENLKNTFNLSKVNALIRRTAKALELNAIAINHFQKAQQLLYSNDFKNANTEIQSYTNSTNYFSFPKFDNRKTSNPNLSIIIVAYNTNQELLKCINSVISQNNELSEIIIVDNGGNDAVLAELINLPILYIRCPENLILSEGRNIGSHFAKGEILAFLDDDAIAETNWTYNIIQAFKKYDIVALRGKVLPKNNNPYIASKPHYDLGEKAIFINYIDTEGNCAIQKSIYHKFKGMNPLLFGGEGFELSYRIKKDNNSNKIAYIPSIIIYHDYALSSQKNNVKSSRHNVMNNYLRWKYYDIDNFRTPVYEAIKPLNIELPFISICIPTYNRANYISKAIESALNQNYENYEIVIVDDGSNDITKEIIRQFNSTKIRYILKEHTNAPDTRNHCIKESKGEFILWLDSDDELISGILNEYAKIIQSGVEFDVIYCNNVRIFNNDKKEEVVKYQSFNGFIPPAKFFGGPPIPNIGTLIRKSVFSISGMYNTQFKRAHDYEFWVRIIRTAKFIHCPIILYKHNLQLANQNQLSPIDYKSTDLSYEINITKYLINNFKIEEIFTDIDWNSVSFESKKNLLANSYLKFAEIFLMWNGISEAIENIEKSNNLEPTSEKQHYINVLKNSQNQILHKRNSKGFRVIAIISAYNEADIIYHVIGDLIKNGVEVYLIDNSSTDETVEQASKWLNKGLLHIESFPKDCGYPVRNEKEFVWKDILRRKEELAGKLDADWFIHADADEFRESVFSGTTLSEGIKRVDELGYNAINFELFNFRPTNNSFIPYQDVRNYLTKYEPGSWFDSNQIKAWKNPNQKVDLVTNGGHIVVFDGLNVFPINFILRHYPIRSAIHGKKKILGERIQRYSKDEINIGWHCQYNEFVLSSKKLLWDEKNLEFFDIENIRQSLINRYKVRENIYKSDIANTFNDLERKVITYNKNVDILFSLAKIYYNFQDYYSCKILLFRILEIEPNNENASILLNNIHKFVNNPKVVSDIITVSIIIPVFNKSDLTKNCIESIYKFTDHKIFELIIVDNGSTDETQFIVEEFKKKYSNIKYLKNSENLGYAKANNIGAKAANSNYILLLNNDTIALENWLNPMLELIINDKSIAAVGAKLLYEDNTIQHAGVAIIDHKKFNDPILAKHLFFKFDRSNEHVNKLMEFQAVTGACMMLNKQYFFEVGGLDESYWNGYEDVDLCFKLRERGYKIIYQPKSELYHLEEKSGKERYSQMQNNFDVFHNKWLGKVSADFMVDINGTMYENKPNGIRPYELHRAISKFDEIEYSASVIILTYNSSSTIVQCLESTKAFLRNNDEVIIVDNNSSDNTLDLVKNIVSGDGRFKIIKNEKNLGFSAGTNVGIKLSRNQIVIMLNPDTIVNKHWLTNITNHFKNKDITAVGPVSNRVAGNQRMELYPKDDLKGWNLPDVADYFDKHFKGQQIETKLLIGFCLAVRLDFIQKYGGLDEDLFLGNDDLELSWRIKTNGGKLVVALDAFVYHVGQASFKTEAKSHTDRLVQESTDALYRKLEKYYGYGNVPSPMELWGIGWFSPTNPRYKNSTNEKNTTISTSTNSDLTSIIILAKDQYEYTKECIDSIYEFTPQNFELILVDNGSKDNIPIYFRKLKHEKGNVKIITNYENVGFPKGVNQALRQASGKYILIGNNDTIVTPDWLKKMIAHLEKDPKNGLVGPISNNISGPQIDKDANYKTLDEMLQYADSISHKNFGKIIEFPRLAFFCTLIKREVFDKIGGLDERFSPGNYEDDDFCMRAQVAGFKAHILRDVFIHHYRSRSFSDDGNDAYKNRLKVNREKFAKKWGGTPDEIWLEGKLITPPDLYVRF